MLCACFAAFVHALLSSSCVVQKTPLVDLEDDSDLEGMRPLPMMFMYCLAPAKAVGGGHLKIWAKVKSSHSRGSDVFMVVHVTEDLAG